MVGGQLRLVHVVPETLEFLRAGLPQLQRTGQGAPLEEMSRRMLRSMPSLSSVVNRGHHAGPGKEMILMLGPEWSAYPMPRI